MTAIAEGVSTITARVGEKTATCSISVHRKQLAINHLEVSPLIILLRKGETFVFDVVVDPEEAGIDEVTWLSSDNSIAVVENGTVTAINSGLVTITAESKNNNCIATCKVVILLASGKPAPNQIVYTTIDSSLVSPSPDSVFGDATIVSNDMIDGIGVISFDQDVHLIGFEAFCAQNKLKTIVLPEGVRTIGEGAFRHCWELRSISFPKSLQEIGELAFLHCLLLESVDLHEGLIIINNLAFAECESFTEISVPEGVIKLGRRAFGWCRKLSSITLPESLKEIGEEAFYACTDLKSVNLPSGITILEDDVFGYCQSLTEVKFNEGLTTIGAHSFEYCSRLEEIKLPNSIKTIMVEAFDHCTGLKKVSLPENDSFYCERAVFSGCTSLSEMIFPSGLKSIPDFLLADCSNLQSVVLSANVSFIGAHPFIRCPKLEKIICFAKTPPLIEYFSFSETQSLIYVPGESLDVYKSSNTWVIFANRIRSIDGIPASSISVLKDYSIQSDLSSLL